MFNFCINLYYLLIHHYYYLFFIIVTIIVLINLINCKKVKQYLILYKVQCKNIH